MRRFTMLGLFTAVVVIPAAAMVPAIGVAATVSSPAVTPTAVEQVPLSNLPAATDGAGAPSVPGRVVASAAGSAGPAVREFARPAPFSMAAIRWTAATPAEMHVRAQQANGTWGPWYSLSPMDAAGDGDAAATATDPVFVGHTNALQVQASTADSAQVTLVVLAPDERPTPTGAGVQPTGVSAAAVRMPTIISRAAWGADESLHCSQPEYADRVHAAVVHHTDGSNDYTPEQSASIVRGIYAYHAQTLDWCDIGYNALVDKYGQIFEGAAGGVDKAVIGAHAGGFNTGTVGVSMMGDYTSIAPTEPELNSVARYLAWQSGIWGLDPHGSTQLTSGGGSYTQFPEGTVVTVPQLMGHRDVDITACPGDVGYTDLGNIRDRAASYLALAGNPQPTTTTASVLNAAVGVPGVAFAAVAPAAASGTVSFSDGATPLAGCSARPLVAGSATCVTGFASAGVHTITASYDGDSSYAPSAGGVPVDVAAAPNFFQVVSGYLIQFAQFFHLFGL